MKSTFIALILAVIPLAVVASARDRVWQMGKVLDTRENAWFAGVTSWSDTYGTHRERTTVAFARARYADRQYFVIEGDTTVYQARERLWWRWSKPADVAVNGAVRYAVDKRKLVVVDDEGKEHQMEIVKRTLKGPAAK
jgi:hypothetical protein